MSSKVFFLGINEVPQDLKMEESIHCILIDSPYKLQAPIQEKENLLIAVVFLPYLDLRHLNIFSYFKKINPALKIFFVLQEISAAMRLRMQEYQDFSILWAHEQQNLKNDLIKCLNGKKIEVRQDRRDQLHNHPLISPSLLNRDLKIAKFKPIFAGFFKNISVNGSCVILKNKSYGPKEFINVTYQNKEGEYISVEAQVRWTQWNPHEQYYELGLRFLGQI